MPFSFGFILKFMESSSLGPEEKGEEGSYCQEKPLDSPYERNEYKLILQKTKWRPTSCWKPISEVCSKPDVFFTPRTQAALLLRSGRRGLAPDVLEWQNQSYSLQDWARMQKQQQETRMKRLLCVTEIQSFKRPWRASPVNIMFLQGGLGTALDQGWRQGSDKDRGQVHSKSH